jgi:hypothetical protein
LASLVSLMLRLPLVMRNTHIACQITPS